MSQLLKDATCPDASAFTHELTAVLMNLTRDEREAAMERILAFLKHRLPVDASSDRAEFLKYFG